ncbi:MAG: EF-hand domain-containing protein [Rhizobiaceae bacterium]
MRKSKLAILFLAMAGTASTAAFAAEQGRRDGRDGPRAQMRFERADADSSGDVTFEEFTAAVKGRMANADADGDGKMTVGEIADQIERNRLERAARRFVERFDTDGDGALTVTEIEARQQKMFTWLDRNDDGKLTQDEMPKRGGKRRH